MNLRHLTRGAASADKLRRRLQLTGETMAGQPLWSGNEIGLLRSMYPAEYADISKALKRRSYWSVRHKAQKLGLAPKRHVWTGPDVSRLRRIYPTGTKEEILAAFPGMTIEAVRASAPRFKVFKARKPFNPTGYPVIDQLRERAFQLGYSMVDLDALARSKRYFASGGWHSGHINHAAIGRAAEALDGRIIVAWNDEEK